MRYKKILFYIIIVAFILSLLSIFFADYAINKATTKYLYGSVDEVHVCKSALLLGTSKLLDSGNINPYFKNRIDATVELYESGKISHIVISGDNSRKEYNEPQDMKDALVLRGISSEDITLDYAGFNTYDSVQRMKKIFSQKEFIIVSQKFHNQRAIYISQSIGLKAYGYNAQDLDSYYGFKVNMREKLARVKMFIDIIFKREPKFLGDKIDINF